MGRRRGQKGRNPAAPGPVVFHMGGIGRGGGGVGVGVRLNGFDGAKGGRRGVVGGRRRMEREEGAGGVRGGDELSELLLEAKGTDPTWIRVALVRMLATLHPFFLHHAYYTSSSSFLFNHFFLSPPHQSNR